jgi:hypothetical protein
MAEDPARRRAELTERAAYHLGAQRIRSAQESAKAQVLIDRFVSQATSAGLPTEELTARPWSGRGRYRTGIRGWYLLRDRSVGVGVDGRYYVLVVAPVLLGRWRPVAVAPTPPLLQVGRGARDGESVALDAALEAALRSPGGPRTPGASRRS